MVQGLALIRLFQIVIAAFGMQPVVRDAQNHRTQNMQSIHSERSPEAPQLPAPEGQTVGSTKTKLQ